MSRGSIFGVVFHVGLSIVQECSAWFAWVPCGGLGACLEVQILELFLMLVYRLAGSLQRARIAGFHGEVWVHVIRLQFRSRS